MTDSQYINQWRASLEATETLQLSKGPAVIKTSVSLLDLAAAGQIPTTLLLELDEIGNKAKNDPMAAGAESLAKMAPAVNAVAIAAFVDPPLAMEADEDHLAVATIPFQDRLAVFQRLNRGVEPLRPFLPEDRKPDGTAHSGDDVSPAAIADSGGL